MFAMGREPEYFRDIKWGTDIESLSNMIIVNESKFEKMCEEKDEKERDWLIRTGVGYQFHFGEKYSRTPEFIVDFSEHEKLFTAKRN